jgi:drug/metabolite transporter (DMT)-like permease
MAGRIRAADEAATPGTAIPPQLLLVLGFLTIYVVWGSTYLAIAWGIETIPPLLLMGVRFLVAGGLLYGWARWRGAERPRPEHWGAALATGALLFGATHGLLAWAETRVPSGLAALLGATSPLWIVLLGRGKQGAERSPLPFLGSGVGILGVLVLMGPSSLQGEQPDLLGAGAVLLSAWTWSVGVMRTRAASLPASLPLASALQLLAGGVLLVVGSVVTGEPADFDIPRVSARSILGLVFLVVLGSIVAFTVYGWLLRVSTPVRISTHSFVNPLVAVLLGWALNGEVLSVRLLIAGAVIVVAIVLVVLGGRRMAKPLSTRTARSLHAVSAVRAGPRQAA